MDAQLAADVDQPQKDYFDEIANRMPDGSNIILCGPEPGWLYTLKRGNKSLSVVDNIGWSAINAKRNLKIPIVLSGDTHHYSRYSGDDGITQFITSGGGGAFLHSTHQLEDTVNLNREAENISWLGGKVKKISLKTNPGLPHNECDTEACYPTKPESLRLLKGNFKFVRLNLAFCILLGAIYGLLGLSTLGLWPDSILMVPLIFGLGFWAYTKKQEGKSKKVMGISALNGIVHGACAMLLAYGFDLINSGLPDFCGWHIPKLFVFMAEMTVSGGFIGGSLFGLYLYLSSKRWNINHNDAFSSMRLDSHRNFLRIRIKDDEVQIFPIGLEQIPARTEWKLNTDGVGCPAPEYIPTNPLKPHLIEGPIIIRAEGPAGVMATPPRP